MKYLLKLITACLFIPFTQSGTYAHPPGDPWVAHYMWRLYYNTAQVCNDDPSAPVYKCTGIILRATSPQKEPDGGWVPEKKSYPGGAVSAGGVSFSYIRADATFGRLAFDYENGFTLFPQMGKYANPKASKLQVLCAFPLDADTDNRTSMGCGPTRGTTTGAFCPDQYAWMNDFEQQVVSGKINETSWAHIFQCGYDLSKSSVDSKANFYIFLLMKQTTDRLAQASTFTAVNELRIKTWASNYAVAASKSISETLPIQSFFYINGSKNGLNNARIDQEKYYSLTGKFIPIVRITMPTKPHPMGATTTTPKDLERNFDFSYQREDQSPMVNIPYFPDKDPLPCKKTLEGGFDMVCNDNDQATINALNL